MAKIIKLNENDLKRIVTKVLNERKQLNEVLPALAVYALWTAGVAINQTG